MEKAQVGTFFSPVRKNLGVSPSKEVLAAVFLLLIAAATAPAQTCSVAQLRIVVRDSTGTPVSGAQVWLGDDEKEGARLTDAEGAAEFKNPPCGKTTVHISNEGFGDVRKEVEITGEAPIEVNSAVAPQAYAQSLEVHVDTPALTESASSMSTGELKQEEVKYLPYVPSTVSDTLTKLPGLMRSADGEIVIDGAAEQHGAFLLNQTDVTDPATGKFGLTVPMDVVEAVNVLQSPFSAEYGNFTSGIVTVETRRAAEKWHAELQDPFPEMRIRSTRFAGLRSSTPRFLASGAIIPGRLTFLEGVQYYLYKEPNKTLPFPLNESKQESVNSYSQWDYVVSPEHLLTWSFHFAPQHINYVRPDYFNPQPVTPSYAHHNYRATVSDHLAVGKGTLESIASFQRFDVKVGAQGTDDMILTPTGNRGNYFASQHRNATRAEWREMWSPAQVNRLGNHNFKVGLDLNYLNDSGQLTARPIDIQDINGVLLRRIQFAGGSPYNVEDYEAAGLVQDSWTVRPNLTFEIGGRLARQSVAHSLRFAPRFGFAWSPFGGTRTVIRGGYGRFYDRVPLNVYSFRNFPTRTITDFDALGNPIDVVTYANVIGTDAGPASSLVHSASSYGSFAPRNATWKIGIEHQVSRSLSLRVFYEKSRSVGLIDMEKLLTATPTVQLTGGGRSQYRQLEASGRVDWKKGQMFLLTYTHSQAQGHLNDFGGFVGNFPTPVIRQDYFSNLPGDTPNRVLAWGRVNGPLKTYFLPLAEFRNGYPYAQFDALQNYVGMPNSQLRFPNYFSLDNRVVRDFLYRSKYTLRFSFTVFNMTDHFNPLAVHANIADPEYGTFFGYYRRRYRVDFELIF